MSRSLSRLALCCSLAACTVGRYPAASSQRPLSLPDGEHQTAVAWRFEPGPDSPDETTPHHWPLTAKYRYGLTDRLNYQFPLRVGYAWPNERVQTALAGGIDSGGYVEDWAKRFRGDPRLPNTTMSAWEFVLALEVSAKLILEHRALLAAARVGQQVFNGQARNRGAALAVTWQLDASDKVSASFSAQTRLERNWYLDRNRLVIVVGGMGSDGYAPVPMLAVHLTPLFDLMLAAEWRWVWQDRKSSAGLFAGVDVHGD